jgi:hypothetical protein
MRWYVILTMQDGWQSTPFYCVTRQDARNFAARYARPFAGGEKINARIYDSGK